MPWNVLFFETARGERIVFKFIESLQKPAISKISHYIDILEQRGPLLSMPYSKKLTNNIFELRIRGREEVRIFYSYVGDDIYLLHAYLKKSQKTPANEIKTAENRLVLLTKR